MGRIIRRKSITTRLGESYYKKVYNWLKEVTGVEPEKIPTLLEEAARYITEIKVASLSRLYGVPEDVVVSALRESGYNVEEAQKKLEKIRMNESQETQNDESSESQDDIDEFIDKFILMSKIN